MGRARASGDENLEGGGDGPPTRPPHWIRPDEVDPWLAASVNKRVTYHRTTREAADNILEHGVDVSRSRRGAYGVGFYTATAPVGLYGDTELQVAVRTRQPLAGEPPEVEAVIDPLVLRLSRGTGRLSPPVADALRRELLALAYDAIIVRDAEDQGLDYVIALEAAAVKVVMP
jgi:hypothetical protein